MAFWWQIRLGLPKGSAIAIVKVLGQNDTYVFWVFSSNGFRLPKGFLECSPNCPAHSSQQSLPRFLGKWLLLQKRFCGGFNEDSPNHSLHHWSPKWLLLHKKFFGEFRQLHLLTCLNHPNRVHRKRPIMSLLLGYSLGLFHQLIRINSHNSHNSSVASIQKRGTLLIRLETGVSNSRSSSSGTSGRWATVDTSRDDLRLHCYVTRIQHPNLSRSIQFKPLLYRVGIYVFNTYYMLTVVFANYVQSDIYCNI